jgi:hypothetical protein
VRGLRAGACAVGVLALGLLAGGTPEREIYVSVRLEGGSTAPDTVVIETHDVIPVSVAPGQRDVPVYGLLLTRRSAACGAPLYLLGLGLRIGDLDGGPIDAGEVIDRLHAEVGGRAASSVHDADPSSSPRDTGQERDEAGEALIEVSLSDPAAIPAGAKLEIEISADINPLVSRPGFAVTLGEGTLSIAHSGCPSPVLLVRHEGSPGAGVSTTTIISKTLAGSFSNYPNPFSAGREMTTFAFYLQRRADVSLKLYDGFGGLVRVLDPGTSRGGGRVHEDITWDGADENGAAVQNGAYFAVLAVRYDDGRSDKAIRKVAVLR